MASTSASCIQKSFKYDVFLSFRGEDTRKSFVDHLYHALKQRGIYTYKDDKEIKKGKRINDELIKSIKDSKLYIVIFSKNYASSSWCLDELVKIMECQKTNGHTAYPVFYDVEPTEVRKQSGAVGEAFSKHNEEEEVWKWRDALREVADLAGWELKNTFDGHEAKFIQEIVKEISLELSFDNLSIDGKLIGMKKRVKDVVSYLDNDTDDVRMIGIKGIGGGGKTTLAKVVYDQISIQFEGSSFVENVREFSSSWGLKSLQKQLLSDVLNDPNIIVKGVADLKKILCGIKVLIVLDDVDHINQLEALAGEPDWFKPGSRIIITTREEQVLIAHGLPKNLILDVNLLSFKEANCLFNRYAFGKEIPNEGYEMLSNQVVCYAAGLPLTIKVLGSFLRGKDELEWIDALERLKTIPLKETLEILELSYNCLEQDYKEIFLDVACLLKGWKKESAIIALESCGFHAINGLKVLELKSLITMSNDGCLSMHDHIEEMGKNIVRRLHPDEPHRHSRLWFRSEINDIFVQDKVTQETRCITLRLLDPVMVMKGLRNMKELRFLVVKCSININKYGFAFPYNNTWGKFDYPFFHHNDSDLKYHDIDEDGKYLPNSLRYLYWNGYPFTCLPANFEAKNLVGLVMLFSNIDQLWKGEERKVLQKLRFIDIRCCMLRTLDVGPILNLESLNLEVCDNLVELHMPVQRFKLKFLKIYRSRLRHLDLSWAENLVTLKVENCENLIDLHMPLKSLELKHLRLQCSKLKTLNLMWSLNLETIDLHVCQCLEELHMPDENFKLKSFNIYFSNLRTLDLARALNLETLSVLHCNDLIDLHMPVKSPKLKHLNLQCCRLKTVNLTQAENLETLDPLACADLVELHMPVISRVLKVIYIRCYKLRTLNLIGTQNLQRLELVRCDDLVELRMPLESPKLKTINIRCPKLRTLYLGLSPCLECLDLHDCFDLVEIHAPVGCLSGYVTFKPILVNPESPASSLTKLHLIARSLGTCPLHPDNDLLKFHFECSYTELLLSSTLNLAKLIAFSVCSCTNLASLSRIICHLQLRKLTLEGSIPEVPKELDQLECLEELNLLSTNIEHLPDSICTLKHLKLLQLKSCWFLKQLPQDIGRLECLEELRLTDCTSLRDIPNSICEMKRLKCFHLTNCILIEKLPKEIGCLKYLKELNIEGTGIRDFPSSIFQLEDLLFLF